MALADEKRRQEREASETREVHRDILGKIILYGGLGTLAVIFIFMLLAEYAGPHHHAASNEAAQPSITQGCTDATNDFGECDFGDQKTRLFAGNGNGFLCVYPLPGPGHYSAQSENGGGTGATVRSSFVYLWAPPGEKRHIRYRLRAQASDC